MEELEMIVEGTMKNRIFLLSRTWLAKDTMGVRI